MKRIFLICTFFALLPKLASAQSVQSRALRNIEKGKWEKAESFLLKSVERKELMALTHYAWALFYFDKDNPKYHVDSAYLSTQRAIDYALTSTGKEREKMRKFSVDSTALIVLRSAIDSVAFLEARSRNTEAGYIQFLAKHPFAENRSIAEQLRNAVAFLDATQQNTHMAFKSFLDKYPQASEANDAKARYERLLFEDKTKDRRLGSFESFLKEHPQTPFRKDIEKEIFELFTLSGDVERFLSFLRLYPASAFKKRATDLLFHVLYDRDDQTASGQYLTDSLQQVVSINQGYLVPFFKRGKFGFMNSQGFEVIAPTFEEIPQEYLCGNVAEDVLVLANKLVGRNGATIYAGNVEEVDDIGAGFLMIKAKDCSVLVHKSGFLLDSCVLDAKILNKRFLAILSKDGWQMVSFSGRPLMTQAWDAIDAYDNVLVLTEGKRKILMTFQQVADAAHEHEFTPSLFANEVKLLDNRMLCVRSKTEEGIFDQNLKEIIPLSDHRIKTYRDHYTVQSRDGFTIVDQNGRKSTHFEQVIANEHQTIIKKNGRYQLFDHQQQKEIDDYAYDSVSFSGPFLKAFLRDSLHIYFKSGQQSFPDKTATKFIAGKDSSAYLLLELEGKKTLYDEEGIPMFFATATSFENMQHAGRDFFIVNKREKKGLLDSQGKTILPIEYDAIGTVSNDAISFLRSMRFGLLSLSKRKLIKPQYDKNITIYNPNLLIAFRDGFQGFIDWDNKPKSRFEFEEIKYWSDSIALVKRNNLWDLYEIATQKTLLSNIKTLIPVKETPDEKLYIMNQNNLFGVYSSQRGNIIPFSFTDLVNVGSSDAPLYFTEKHVSEASVFVVIYYDKSGKMLRREVYEDPEDYEKIYCAEK